MFKIIFDLIQFNSIQNNNTSNNTFWIFYQETFIKLFDSIYIYNSNTSKYDKYNKYNP